MPWNTPTLRQTREQVRDEVTSALSGAILIGNNVLRVMSDAQAGLCHLVLRFIDWLALQLLPDTAETEWLDRHGDIWLVNSDGTTGRKAATLAQGTATVLGAPDVVIPVGARLSYGGVVEYEVIDEVILLDDAPTPIEVRALDPGTAGNIQSGATLTFLQPIDNLTENARVEYIGGGAEVENDDNLRIRVLERIREPPMGGAQHDYVRWAKAVPGVTRAWCAPNEMGIGTVTVRIMCDETRADNDGFPLQEDLDRVAAYIDLVRPVAVKDHWVLSPIRQPIDLHIIDLSLDSPDVRAAIEDSINDLLLEVAAPGQTIFAAWKYSAVMNAPGVISFKLSTTADDVMPSNGHMAVLGDIIYGFTYTP